MMCDVSKGMDGWRKRRCAGFRVPQGFKDDEVHRRDQLEHMWDGNEGCSEWYSPSPSLTKAIPASMEVLRHFQHVSAVRLVRGWAY